MTTIEATTSYDLGPVMLTGLALTDAFAANLTFPPRERFHTIVGHRPSFSLSPGTGHLLVAGHTHGGQVRLPCVGPLMTLAMVPRAWAPGVTAIDADTTLTVSRGIGMKGADAPRRRFLCQLECVVVDLVPA